jgi:hypothetical protein
MSSKRLLPPRLRATTVRPSSLTVSEYKTGKNQIQAADEQRDHCGSGNARVYLTRAEVAERYPISIHTLAKLASQQRGPRFYKPTDKALYRPEDIEAWIEASAIMPIEEPTPLPIALHKPKPPPQGGRGRALPQPKATNATARSGRKSLPPSPNSWLRREH